MQSFIAKYKFGLLFVVSIALVWVIDLSNFSFENNKPNVGAFSTILFEKEAKADAIIDSLFSHAKSKQLAVWVNNNSITLDYLCDEQGLVFFAFLNSDLVYWTSNSIAITDTLHLLNNKFAKQGNNYVEIRKKQNDTITIVGLINIMDSYPYENKFLTNGFHPTFNLNCPYSLIIDETAKNFAVYNNQNSYLFSFKSDFGCNAKLKPQILVVLIFIACVFLLLFGYTIFKGVTLQLKQFAAFSLTLIAFRVAIQVYQVPAFFGSLSIFQPQHFAFSNIFPSLGDLLLTSILILFLIFIFYTKVKLTCVSRLSTFKKHLVIVSQTLVILIYAQCVHQIFYHLIVNSAFQYEAFDVLGLSFFSFVGYFIMLILFIGLILLIDKFFIQIKASVKFKHVLAGVLVLAAFFLAVALLMSNKQIILPILFLLVVLLYWVYVRFKKAPSLSNIIIVIAVFAAFSTTFIRQKNAEKRVNESKVMAVNLARDNDPVAEVVLSDAIQNIKNDSLVVRFLQSELFDFNEMAEYLKQSYFTGYLGQYNFQLTICNASDSVLLDAENENWQHCYSFFNNLIKAGGVETNIPGLFYLNDNVGGLNYFMRIPIKLSPGWQNVTLFFELTLRPNTEVLGYPELLLEKPIPNQNTTKMVSYAKYKNNKLVMSSGEFPYALERYIYGFADAEFASFKSEGYNHLLYNPQPSKTVLVSFPSVHFYNIVISFTYIFFFLLIQTILLLLIGNRFIHLIDINLNVKNKIVFSMILILLISLFFVGGGTIMYTYNRFEKSQMNILSEKIQSVLVELDHKITDYENINDISADYLNNMLINFSNVFYTDINLYDSKGNLAGTSRKEIFDRNLTGKKINAIAYRELVLNKKARVVHKEQIGRLEYYSAYVPLINSDNKLLAYLNLPYFSKEVLLRTELLNVLVAVVNIYAFLLVLSILIAIYISNLVTEPLRMVQQRIRNIDLSKHNERIAYHGRDEIGDLVIEYNRMLDALDKSAGLLAKSERETAWREMARQIAHEINNPLTPMKLSIQMLDKSWKNHDADFEARFQRSTKTLIEQIDSLSSIAGAFSQFARMPIARSERVNIVERIHRSAELFNQLEFASVELNLPTGTEVFVRADNERMLQVFNNLFKNAVQAIPDEKQGKISINLSQTHTHVVVEVCDNGVGVPAELANKLFQPNFTTKTSGTGLGLAIVKNIVDEFGGAIWFKSEPGVGSSFYISMPLYTDEVD